MIKFDVIYRGDEGKKAQVDGRYGQVIWEGECEAVLLNPWAKPGVTGEFRIVGDGMIRDYDNEFDFCAEGEDDVEEAVSIFERELGEWVLVRENVWASDFREQE